MTRMDKLVTWDDIRKNVEESMHRYREQHPLQLPEAMTSSSKPMLPTQGSTITISVAEERLVMLPAKVLYVEGTNVVLQPMDPSYGAQGMTELTRAVFDGNKTCHSYYGWNHDYNQGDVRPRYTGPKSEAAKFFVKEQACFASSIYDVFDFLDKHLFTSFNLRNAIVEREMRPYVLYDEYYSEDIVPHGAKAYKIQVDNPLYVPSDGIYRYGRQIITAAQSRCAWLVKNREAGKLEKRRYWLLDLEDQEKYYGGLWKPNELGNHELIFNADGIRWFSRARPATNPIGCYVSRSGNLVSIPHYTLEPAIMPYMMVDFSKFNEWMP